MRGDDWAAGRRWDGSCADDARPREAASSVTGVVTPVAWAIADPRAFARSWLPSELASTVAAAPACAAAAPHAPACLRPGPSGFAAPPIESKSPVQLRASASADSRPEATAAHPAAAAAAAADASSPRGVGEAPVGVESTPEAAARAGGSKGCGENTRCCGVGGGGCSLAPTGPESPTSGSRGSSTAEVGAKCASRDSHVVRARGDGGGAAPEATRSGGDTAIASAGSGGSGVVLSLSIGPVTVVPGSAAALRADTAPSGVYEAELPSAPAPSAPEPLLHSSSSLSSELAAAPSRTFGRVPRAVPPLACGGLAHAPGLGGRSLGVKGVTSSGMSLAPDGSGESFDVADLADGPHASPRPDEASHGEGSGCGTGKVTADGSAVVDLPTPGIAAPSAATPMSTASPSALPTGSRMGGPVPSVAAAAAAAPTGPSPPTSQN